METIRYQQLGQNPCKHQYLKSGPSHCARKVIDIVSAQCKVFTIKMRL